LPRSREAGGSFAMACLLTRDGDVRDSRPAWARNA